MTGPAPLPPAMPVTNEALSPSLKTLAVKTKATRDRILELEKQQTNRVLTYDFEGGFRHVLKAVALRDIYLGTDNKIRDRNRGNVITPFDFGYITFARAEDVTECIRIILDEFTTPELKQQLQNLFAQDKRLNEAISNLLVSETNRQGVERSERGDAVFIDTAVQGLRIQLDTAGRSGQRVSLVYDSTIVRELTTMTQQLPDKSLDNLNKLYAQFGLSPSLNL